MKKFTEALCFMIVLALGAAGCSDDATENEPNNSTADTGTDVSSDTDTDHDTTADAGDTYAPDTSTDTGTDADAGQLPEVACVEDRFAATEDSRLQVELASTDVTLDLTFDGNSLSDTETDLGVNFFFARFHATDSPEVSIAQFGASSPNFSVFRGTYDGWIGASINSSELGRYSVAFPAVTGHAFESETETLTMDLETVRPTVSVTADGQALPDVEGERRGFVMFAPRQAPPTSLSHLTTVPIPASGEATVEPVLANTSYDVYVKGAEGSGLPEARVLAASDWNPADNPSTTLDIETASVLSEVLKNGQALADVNPGATRGKVEYVPQTTGGTGAATDIPADGSTEIDLGSSGAAVFEPTLSPDVSYDVYIEADGAVLPQIRHRVADDWTPADGDVVEYDVTTHELTLALTANGETIAPNTSMRRGTVRVFQPSSDSAQNYALLALSEGIELYEETYDLTVRGNPEVSDSNTLPPTAESVIATDQTIESDTDLTHDIETIEVTGELTAGGEPLAAEPNSGVALFLPSDITYETIQDMQLARVYTHTASDGYAVTLSAGQEYDVYWFGNFGQSNPLPTVVEPVAMGWSADSDATLDFELPAAHAVDTTLRLDGEPFPVVPAQGDLPPKRATLTFDPTGTLDSFDASNDFDRVRESVPGEGSPTVRVELFGGEYELMVDTQYNTGVAVRGLQIIECEQ